MEGFGNKALLFYSGEKGEKSVSLFKRKVQDATREAVATVKEAAAKVTTEKMDIWGDAAKIGTFAIMAFGAIKAFGQEDKPRRPPRSYEDEVVRTITVNNYYYRQPGDNRRRRK